MSTAAVAVLAGLVLPIGVAGAGSLADADAEVAALRQQADEASKAYIDALATATTLELQIAEIKSRLPALTEQRHALRVIARSRAVAAYKRSGVQFGSIIGANDVLTAMRRTHWLDQLSARDNSTLDLLAVVTARLEAQRTALQQARQAQQVALDELQARGRDIDAKLQAAEDRARKLRAVPPRPVVPKGTGGQPPAAPVDYVPTPGSHPRHAEPALICIRTRESDRGDRNGNGLHDAGYGAYNPAGPYMGAYQFLQSTWNSTANRAGRPELIGVPPHTASAYDQDDMAWSLYQRSGSGPWGGSC
jgi:hypothetical protein